MISDISLRAVLVCNLAFRDEHRKWSVIGIFDRMMPPALPVQCEPFIYVRLADVTRGGELSIVVRTPSGSILTNAHSAFPPAPQPRMDADIALPMQLRVQDVGTYTIDVEVNGERIGGAKFTVELQGR